MKKSLYLVTAFCMAAFSSCSSDEGLSPESGQEQTAKIQLTLTGSSATRANSTTDPATGVASAEATVGNIVVGIFDGDGNKLVVQKVSSPSTSSANPITVPMVKGTMNGCTGVVVANVPAASLSALESATIKTKTSFLAQTISLQNATTLDGTDEGDDGDGDVQVSTILPMSGEVKDASGTAGVDGNADKDNNATTFSLTSGGTTSGLKASLVRMVSRITLRSLSADFTGTAYPSATFKLQRVFLRDAIDKNNVTTSATPADAMPSDATYIKGGGTWSSTAWTDDVNDYLFDDLTGSEVPVTTATQPGGKYYWFYALANSSSTNPTAFVIQGLFNSGEEGASDVPVFYPVIIGKIQTGTTFDTGTGSTTGSIIRNSLYNLTVNIKGKGATSPTDNINPVNLSISVEVAGWNTTIVGQTVDFD